MDSLKIHTYFICLFLLISVNIYSQTISDELKMLNKTFIENKSLSFDISYKVYPNYSSKSSVENLSGKYYKLGRHYYWQTGSQIIVQNDRYFISIDHENKNILVGDPVKKSTPFLAAPIDSLLKLCSKSSMIDLGNGRKKISLVFESYIDNVSKIEIVKGKDDLINSLVFYYVGFKDEYADQKEALGESPRLELKFENTSETIVPDIFTEKKYFTLSGKGIILSREYNDYSLIDQRIKK